MDALVSFVGHVKSLLFLLCTSKRVFFFPHPKCTITVFEVDLMSYGISGCL
jgi:hypothetical protein